MGSNKIKTIEADTKEDKKSSDKATDKEKAPKDDTGKSTAPAKPVQKKVHSRRYQNARAQVDKTRTYPLQEAVKLVKKLGSKKHPTLTADINYADAKLNLEVSFPHSTGKTLKVAIASPALLKQIEKGQIDFDVLLATPTQMKDIARLAKILGPRGLMPNPKNGHITDNPEKRKKELEAGKTNIRCEKKAPIIHCQIGKTTQTDKELIENLEFLIKTLTPQKISRLTLSSTMSPGVKIELQNLPE